MKKYTIRSDTPPDYTLCENDTAASVLQNIALLVATKQGTVPGYREFGLPMRFIGMPERIASTVAAQEVVDAVEQFEPRARVISVEVEAAELLKIQWTVEVEIYNE